MRHNTMTYGVLLLFVFLIAPGTGMMGSARGNTLEKDPAAHGIGIRIVVNQASQINTDRILLGGISQIQASDFLAAAISKIDIGMAPKPGEIRALDERRILSSVRREQYLPEGIKLVFPDQIYVKRSSQSISEDTIAEFVRLRMSNIFKDKECQMVSLSVRGLKPYPLGNVEFSMDSTTLVDKNGRISGFLDVMIDGEKHDKLRLSGEVKVFETVLCVTGSFSRGQTLSRSDVVGRKKNIFELRDDYLRSFDDVDQKILTTSVKNGAYLRSSFLEASPLMKKGDIIRLLAKNANMSIVTSGKCLEDGYSNAVIKVENLSSGQLVQGVVRDKSIVEVVY